MSSSTVKTRNIALSIYNSANIFWQQALTLLSTEGEMEKKIKLKHYS